FALAACGVGTDAPTPFTVPSGPPDPVTASVPDAGSPSTGTADAGTVSQPETSAPGNGIFPPDSPWNTRIDDAPVDPRSDAYIASMGTNGKLIASWDEAGNGLPYVEVPKDQQGVPVSFWGFPKESDPGPYPIPWNAPVQIGSDGHVLV